MPGFIRAPASLPRSDPRNSASPLVEDERGEALEELDDDVAQDGIAHDDVGQVLREVLALDIALEPQARGVEQLRGALDPGVALALLLPDREQRDARAGDPDHALGEDRAHLGVLEQVLRGRVGVGADVEEDQRPGVRDHLDGQGRSVHAGQASEAQDRGGHAGAGMTGGDDGIGLTAADEVHRDEDRGVLLLAQGQGRMLVHADDLGGGHDRDVGREVRGETADDGLVADEDQVVGGMRSGEVEGAGDDLGRAVITAHRVDGDAHAGTDTRARQRLRVAHRVSARRRRRRPA